MTTRASGTFETKTWDETSFPDSAGARKLSHAEMTEVFRGDVEGESIVHFLMTYLDDGRASYVGLERVIGRIGDRSGSFALQHEGVFAGDTAEARWRVVPDSATGDLRGLRGDGSYVWDRQKGPEQRYILDYDFE